MEPEGKTENQGTFLLRGELVHSSLLEVKGVVTGPLHQSLIMKSRPQEEIVGWEPPSKEGEKEEGKSHISR